MPRPPPQTQTRSLRSHPALTHPVPAPTVTLTRAHPDPAMCPHRHRGRDPLSSGDGLSRMAMAATSQEEDSELGMKAGGGWRGAGAPSQAPRRRQWARLATQLPLPVATQPTRLSALLAPRCQGCRRDVVAGAEQRRGHAAPPQLEQTSFQMSSPAQCHRFGGDCCRGEAWSARLIIVQIARNANLGAPGEKCINNITPD